MIDQVRPNQVNEWLAAQAAPRALVLDVREPWELQTASVKPDGFELVAMPMASIPARLAELPADAAIACLCHHGGRSQQVAMFLARQGFGRVANITGGIEAWARERDPAVPRY